MKAKISKLATTVAFLSAASAANAGVISTFDTGPQGWQVGSVNANSITELGLPDWNAGGYITTGDVATEVGFVAPAAYLGDLSSLYGQNVTFDLSDVFVDGVNYANLILYSGTTAITFGTSPPGPSFTPYSINLSENGWHVYPGGGEVGTVAVNQTEFLAVLGNVTGFAIHADWRSGGDFTGLDNVRLGEIAGGVPEPSTWAMIILGFAGMGFMGYRRSRNDGATAATA